MSNEDTDILFLGNMFFQPNQDAVEDIVSKVAPLVFRKNDKVKFKFVGDVPIELKKKYENNRIFFTGRLDDINQAFKGTGVCIVPVKTGGGMRVKILTCMASGIPIVSTKVAATGINIENNLLIADDMVKFADMINELLLDRQKSLMLGRHAYLEAKKIYS